MTHIVYDPYGVLVPTYHARSNTYRFEGVPEAARWWRIRLTTDDDGCVYYVHVENPHSATLSWRDGDHRSLHPYAVNVEPQRGYTGFECDRVVSSFMYAYVDILTDHDPGLGWTAITPAGHHWHPAHHDSIMRDWTGRNVA